MHWHRSIESDLEIILSKNSLFDEYRNKRVTLLGGSGFIGKWILSTLIHSNENFHTNIDIFVVATNASKLKESYGEKVSAFTFKDLDLSQVDEKFYLPESDFFVHAATSTNPDIHANESESILSLAEKSTLGIIRSARIYQNVPRVIHLSSGIVYPRSPKLELPIPESKLVYEKDIERTYKGAKISIERLISSSIAVGEIKAANPRLFAFSGPGIPTDKHFAIGNFMRDALLNRPIKITGNPCTIRSYMYPTDLVVWLLTILGDPQDVPLNIGNKDPVSLGQLALAISRLIQSTSIVVNQSPTLPDSYFPKIDAATRIYGLENTMSLDEGLKRWMEFLIKVK
jgi:nucleoside-diphosphate-sugar epimerase